MLPHFGLLGAIFSSCDGSEDNSTIVHLGIARSQPKVAFCIRPQLTKDGKGGRRTENGRRGFISCVLPPISHPLYKVHLLFKCQI